MRRLSAFAEGLRGSQRASVAVEFSLILPILLFLLLAFYDAATAFAIYTKTRFAAATLAQLTNQYSTIHDTDLTQIQGAAATVLAPYSATPLSSNITQITIDASGNATVGWSTNLTAGASYPLPTALAVPSSYLIYATVSYVFTPAFGFFVTGPVTLSDGIYTSPRISSSIARISP